MFVRDPSEAGASRVYLINTSKRNRSLVLRRISTESISFNVIIFVNRRSIVIINEARSLKAINSYQVPVKLFKLRTRSGIGAKLEEYLSFPGVDLKAKSREHTTPLSPVADPQAARQLYESNPEDLATDLQSSRARRGRDCLKEK